MDDDILKSALVQAVAKDVIEKMSDEDKTKLLEKALADALKDYRVRGAIESAVAEVVQSEINGFLRASSARDQIRLAIDTGFAELMNQIPNAVKQATAELLFGKEGDGYGRGNPGQIRKFLNLKFKDSE